MPRCTAPLLLAAIARLVWGTACFAACVDAQEPAAAAEALFDGHTLDGWCGDPRFWSVEDGAIVGRSSAEQPCERNTYLIHDGRFGDFELRFSYRLSGGNSGLQYRSRALGDFAVAGPQADLEAGPDHSGILYDERGRGIVARRGERVRIDARGVRRVEVFATEAELQSEIRRDDWNDYVVRAVGPRVVHEINGVTMVDVEDRSAAAARDGILALQLHAGPAMTVRFRDLSILPLGPSALPAAPEWIWTEEVGDQQRIALRRRFELPAALRRATLVATCDNAFELFVDGRSVLRGDDWERARVTTDLGALPAGAHQLAVDARNDGGPAGFVMRLDLECVDGSRLAVVSDRSWRAGAVLEAEDWRGLAFDDRTWQPAHSSGATTSTSGPWPDPFVVGAATPAESLCVPPGYRAELLRSAGIGEGSWIALAFDEQGRALVSQEAGPLARITPDGAGFEIIDAAPRGAMGLCVAFGALYVQGQGRDGFGLYRLRDADADGEYEGVERILAVGSPGEHGGHAVVPGPDGWLWLMQGNMSALPARLAPDSAFAGFGEDLLLPRLEDPRGHANGVRSPGGHVLRCRPDGSEAMLFAAGFRNAYDLAFDASGEAFSFDSDMEWDLGLPWYRPTRVLHVVSGGEYGWRSGAGKWRPGLPDSLPAVVDVGLGSPTGIVHGAALRFPPADRAGLFLGDWAYGRILVVRPRPHGASFDGSFEQFVSGRPLNVTDLAVGPDGALWFTTGGRGTQSGLYRIVWEGRSDTEAQRPAIAADASAARLLRRELEALHGARDRRGLELAWPALGHADRFVRYAARTAVESVPIGLWYERAIALPAGAAALQALLAVARRGEDADRDEVLRRLGAFDPDRFDRAAWIDWLRVHQVALARRSAPVGEDLRLALLLRLDPRYPTADVGVDRLLLQLLVALGDDQVVPRALERLDAVEIVDGIDIAYALRLVPTMRAEDREAMFRWIGEAKALGGGLSRRGYLEAIASDALQQVADADRPTLLRLAAAREPALAVALPDTDGPGQAWTEADLRPYLGEVAQGRDFARGELAYTKAACVACHRFDGRGGDIGPDLTSIGSRFSRRDLLRALLDPSAAVPDQYQDTLLTLRDGRILVGRVVRDGAEIELIVDAVSGRRERVAAAEVASRAPSTRSAMPEGLLTTLTLEEVLVLLAYLESGGNRSHPAFGHR